MGLLTGSARTITIRIDRPRVMRDPERVAAGVGLRSRCQSVRYHVALRSGSGLVAARLRSRRDGWLDEMAQLDDEAPLVAGDPRVR